MTRNELLKLPKGKYLLTDSICNYKYVLDIDQKEYEYGITVGSIYDHHHYTGSTFTPHITIFYSEEEVEVDWSYSKLKVKTLSGHTMIGGLGGDSDFWRNLTNLRMVGKFDRETITQDMKKFKSNWEINLSRYDRKTIRNKKLKRI